MRSRRRANARSNPPAFTYAGSDCSLPTISCPFQGLSDEESSASCGRGPVDPFQELEQRLLRRRSQRVDPVEKQAPSFEPGQETRGQLS